MVAVGGSTTVRPAADPMRTTPFTTLTIPRSALEEGTAQAGLCKTFCMPSLSVTSVKERSVAVRPTVTSGGQS